MKIKDTLVEESVEVYAASTGYYELDDATSGLKPGELIILGARPSMGKTTFAINIAENVAMLNKDKSVLIFSMEMPAESLHMRMIASLGRIEVNKIRNGKIDKDDWSRFGGAVAQLSETKLQIDDNPDLSQADIIRSIEDKMANGLKIGLIVIDYLQLMELDEVSDNRNEELSKILRKLKRIARRFNVPIIVLSQLNRELEKRPNKRPVMSDLRDSGAIEEIADLIIFIYRDEVYNEDSVDRGLAEIIVAKQRNGGTGMLKLRFEGRYSRFDNQAQDYYQS